jgi:hypothetical protein
LAGSFERDGINRAGIHSASEPRKRPNDLKSLSPSTPDGDFRNGGLPKTATTIVPLDFPNIAHGFWENYRLTGDYYLKTTKLSLD